ncbi:MAG: sigma-54-dependent Fis family transcriptional regulator [Candidatus Latescibacteria bacterium]|nr:sigma-54-dependent Fis family transcriptional regulator [Candidatus Latescibacterota bacterium]
MNMTGQVSMTVLVIDDDAHIRSSIGKFLIARGHTVIEAADGEKGVEVVESQAVDIVITDVKMPKMDGLEVLRRVRSISPETEVIVITGVKEPENAFRALREGAFDFFNKPFKVEDLNAAIQRTVCYQTLRKETSRMQARLDRLVAQERERGGLNAIIGASEVVVKMKAHIKQVAAAGQTTVLIIGETGTGKELVARAVHSESDRAGGPFVPVNCSAIPANLFESAFFGHKQGAFTDARTDQKGHFELAHEGTLFLDEIGDMPLEMQVRLLRTLEERCIRPVGGSDEIPVDVRVVAATNRSLTAAVEEGTFREDLYYRLNVFVIQVPPLRERPGDVLFLARHFLADYAQDLRKPLMRFSREAEDLLQQQEFPGNVRMLKNTVERAAILCDDGEIDVDDLGFELVERAPIVDSGVDQVVQSLPEAQMDLPALERALLQEALRRTEGNQVRAAKLLGISRMVLRYRIKKCGLL